MKKEKRGPKPGRKLTRKRTTIYITPEGEEMLDDLVTASGLGSRGEWIEKTVRKETLQRSFFRRKE